MTREEMLREMREKNWDTELTPKDSYRDIKREYEEMINAYESAEDAMFPNGRDYDAEDW